MVEIITIIIISTIIGACSLVLGGVGLFVTVSTTFKMRELEQKHEAKRQKQKALWERKYTPTAKMEDYVKIALLMHFGKKDNKKTSFIKVQGERGTMFLEVTLRKCDFKYKPQSSWYECMAFMDPTDYSIIVSFTKEVARSRWDQYLDQLVLSELEQRYWDDVQKEKAANDSEESEAEAEHHEAETNVYTSSNMEPVKLTSSEQTSLRFPNVTIRLQGVNNNNNPQVAGWNW